MNKLILIFILVILAVTQDAECRKRRYKRSIVPDYESNVPEFKHKCADNVLYSYHHTHPDATRILMAFQNVRRFFMNAFDHCNTLPHAEQEECRTIWKESVADELNDLVDDAKEIDVINGEQWIEDIKEKTVHCLTAGRELKEPINEEL